MKIKKKLWNLHSHSHFSVGDALPSVSDMVATVSRYGQPALGLTDHGNMAGSVQLYKECADAGIKPFPGTEFYVVRDREDTKAKRHHMCMVAYTEEGYQNLVALNTQSNVNFYNKPLLDFSDLAAASEAGLLRGIAGTSGCYFGYFAQAISNGDESQARSLLGMYAKWFDRFYVELQNHEIDHGNGMTDALLADAAMGIAQSMGVPCILTQDSHYCDKHEKTIHETLKRLVAYGPDAEDAVFPGDGFHLADTEWFASHHDGPRLTAGTEGLVDLLDAHSLQIPQLDKYSYNIPFTVPDPDQALMERCYQAMGRLTEKPQYMDRLLEELEVIKATGMAGYLVLVAEVTDWCRANGVFYQARGSASGSIVCWLLKITQADPIKWGLSFERFISKDRLKPPDIDLDVEHERRADLVEMLASRFALNQIGTWSKNSIKGDDDGKGSLRVKYYASKRKQGVPVPDWSKVPADDKEALFALSDDADSLAGFGTHAAGMVITTTHAEFDQLVPTMWVASSKKMVTQYAMDDIEELGLVKLDVLGLKTLTVLRKTIELMGRDPKDGLDWIPLSDGATYRAIARGDTDGVFQLEGWTTKREIKNLRPTKISDIIAAMALFRPATMDSGATDQYIQRRNKLQNVPVRHETLDRITANTYGIFLFQEQVIAALREIGLDAKDLTKFLKAVKASNSNIGAAGEVIKGYKELVYSLAAEHGISPEDTKWMWDSATGFAAYGFNQAHSTAYGLTAYRCAYLAVNYPAEFHAALLDVAANSDKEDQYVTVTRRRGIRVAMADINESNSSYTLSKKLRKPRIRRGLTSIDGVGTVAAREIQSKRPEEGYTSVTDFAKRMSSKVTGCRPFLEAGDLTVGTFGKLHTYGAFGDLPLVDDDA